MLMLIIYMVKRAERVKEVRIGNAERCFLAINFLLLFLVLSFLCAAYFFRQYLLSVFHSIGYKLRDRIRI